VYVNILLLVPLAMAFMILDARELGIMGIGFMYAVFVLAKMGMDLHKKENGGKSNEQET
jgi:hypothetical protein